MYDFGPLENWEPMFESQSAPSSMSVLFSSV